MLLPRVLTAPLAHQLGISRSRCRTELRRGRWQSLARGVVLTVPGEPTREDWADVGVYLGGVGSALTGWDALQTYGLTGRRPPPLVVVLSPTAMNRVVGGVRVRRTSRPYRCAPTALGVRYELTPIVPVSRALADYALNASRDDTLALVARAVQTDRCRIEDLYAEYASGPRNHSAGLRRSLSDVLDGARSVAEARAARRLAAAPVPPFELNVPVIDQRGRLRYVLDVLWRAQRAGLEIDSREHHSSTHDWQRTMIRHNELTRAGLALLHYPPALIMASGNTFARDVARWLVRRSSETGVALASGRGVIRPAAGGTPEPLTVRFT